jgi:hypothetical protein
MSDRNSPWDIRKRGPETDPGYPRHFGVTQSTADLCPKRKRGREHHELVWNSLKVSRRRDPLPVSQTLSGQWRGRRTSPSGVPGTGDSRGMDTLFLGLQKPLEHRWEERG